MKKHPLYATLAGFSMIAVGLCLCRYAYTPLIPSLIDEHWVTKAGAGYLGGFNCLGYLIGCLGALFLPAYLSVRLLLRLSLVIAVGGLVMCAWDLGFVWLALGRAATGLGGASLVVHTPSVVLPHVPENWKKVTSGVVFTGAGGEHHVGEPAGAVLSQPLGDVGLAAGSYGLSGLLSLGMDYYATFLVAQGVLIVALLLAGWLFLRRHQAGGN